MARELERAMKGLSAPREGHPRPFYISYLLHTVRGQDVWGRYGSVFNSEPVNSCDLYAEVRVGSHRIDQSVDGSLNTELSDRESFNWLVGPQDLDDDTIRYTFWKLTDHKYKEALQEYYDKKKILIEQHLRKDAGSFSREDPVILNEPIRSVSFSATRWEKFIREASSLFRKHRRLIDPYVRIRGASRVRIFVSSEGSRFITQDDFYEVIVTAWSVTKQGAYLNASRYFYGRDPKDIPSLAKVESTINAIAEDLKSLEKSRPMEPYAGPALLSGLATGLIFHEAIGHRLEGERMLSRTEGHTFASKIGKRILPASVDLIDDPTLKRWGKQPLYGAYRIDDEGVLARPVKLVEDGVLKTFLLSRATAPGFKRSNGHGRHERYQDPMARMANLIVRSKDQYSWAELKDMLMEEVRRRGLPHGIMVKNVSSGETRTDHYDFQAFKGIPTEVYTVHPKTGKETRVRDVSFIGTPLAAIQRIQAFGRDYQVDNSYCYAESGSVPVATIAPPMLVGDLELQAAVGREYKQPILPFPTIRRR